MKRILLAVLLALCVAAPAVAGQTCIDVRGCGDLTGTTCATDTNFTSQGGKPNPRLCTDTTNGFQCGLTYPANVGTVTAALYGYGVDATGNDCWKIECVCVAVGEEGKDPTLGTAAFVTDADIAAGDLNKVTLSSDVASTCGGSCASGEKLKANVNRVPSGGGCTDTDTGSVDIQSFCLEY